MSSRCDVIIGGGGMVGMTLAIALAKGGLDVVVADPVPKSAALDARFDGRVCALAYATVRMFEALGVWPHLEPHAQPIKDILVTDAKLGGTPSPFSLHFDAGEIGARSLGHIVENRHTRTGLFAVAETLPNLHFVAPAALTNLETAAGGITATLSNGDAVTAQLAVAADGRPSPMRELMGIPIVAWSYDQWGIVATVEHEKPHNGVAYEHFLPSGPFAILPMTPAASSEAVGQEHANRSSLVWTEDEKLAPEMMKLDDDAFNAEIARRFGDHLGATKSAGPRWSHPLKFHLARGFVKPRFALAGDSAHGIHPIAGQGFNLGLKDAAALTDVVLDAARVGLDIGSLTVLEKYERWRRFDSFTMSFAMDGLNRLFSNDIAPIRFARDLGMGIVDAFGPARRFFMRHAGGDIGKLPRLMKGEAA
ncbi:MAG: FAD-dependent monooxygenase [Alphaproteobacteria bacterium]|nr:FAD-dependent monooxygenase [Alphaproteobacteria bacterium]MBL7098840.1 FAD-dependent monooxygenase [Alphaproteobacteria bacterium]